jgi:hypothetical protein
VQRSFFSRRSFAAEGESVRAAGDLIAEDKALPIIFVETMKSCKRRFTGASTVHATTGLRRPHAGNAGQ